MVVEQGSEVQCSGVRFGVVVHGSRVGDSKEWW